MSIKFTIPNIPSQVDYTATSVSNNGATIPVINKPTLSTVATSGKYTDLTAQPTIPTKLSQLTNDSLAVTGTSTLAGTTASSLAVTGTSTLASTTVSGAGTAFPNLTSSNTSPDGCIISVSSLNSQANYNQAYYPFDAVNTTFWASATTYSPAGSGAADGITYNGTVTTTVNGVSIAGEWLQVQTPVPYRILSYNINNNGYKRWSLAGSVNGTTWVLIDSKNLANPAAVQLLNYVPTAPGATGAYSYFRYICQAASGNAVAQVNDMSFYGTTGGLVSGYTVTSDLVATNDMYLTKPYFWYYLQNAASAVATGNIPISGSLFTFNAAVSSPRVTGNLFTTDTATTTASPSTSSATLLFPFSGIYSLVWSARFGASSGENSIWFLPYTTATYINNSNNNRLSYNSTASFQVTTTYTGFFTAGDRVCMSAFTAGTSVALQSALGPGLQVTLLQRTA